MDNLTICKKIAEIEGVELFETYNQVFDRKILVNLYMDKGVKWHHAAESEECFFTKVYSAPSSYKKAVFNPLTDDALWKSLIFKYEVSISFVFCKLLIVNNGVHEKNFADNISLKRNALLLIIEAHNE